MSFTTLLAAPFILYALVHGIRLAFSVLGIFARRPVAGLIFAGVLVGVYSFLPPEVRAQALAGSQNLAELPRALPDLFGDLARIVKEENEGVAQGAHYADEDLGQLYMDESARYEQTYSRVMDRLLESFGDLGSLLALEESPDTESPGDV